MCSGQLKFFLEPFYLGMWGTVLHLGAKLVSLAPYVYSGPTGKALVYSTTQTHLETMLSLGGKSEA